MKIVEMAILSTDLASYFEKRERFLSTADAGEIDWQVVVVFLDGLVCTCLIWFGYRFWFSLVWFACLGAVCLVFYVSVCGVNSV